MHEDGHSQALLPSSDETVQHAATGRKPQGTMPRVAKPGGFLAGILCPTTRHELNSTCEAMLRCSLRASDSSTFVYTR